MINACMIDGIEQFIACRTPESVVACVTSRRQRAYNENVNKELVSMVLSYKASVRDSLRSLACNLQDEFALRSAM